MLPALRTTELLADLYGLSLSTGTVMSMIIEAQYRLSPMVADIARAVGQAPVAHFDETGMRVAGKLYWLHAAVTQTLSWMDIHGRRGKEAIETFGILPGYTGVAIHDGWAPYRDYPCLHGLCNAHHLRELTFVAEVCKQDWAQRMIDLLCATHQSVIAAKPRPLPQARIVALGCAYEVLLAEGESVNPVSPDSGKRGRTK